jgi:hypothetical protein
MKMLTVRLPEKVVAEIEAESRARNVSRSDVVRERLQQPYLMTPHKGGTALELIGDLIGSVQGMPADVSARVDDYLNQWGYGKYRSRAWRMPASSA